MKNNNIYLKLGGLAFVVVFAVCMLRYRYEIDGFKENNSTVLTEIPFYIKKRNTSSPNAINGVPLVIYQSWHSRGVPPKMKTNIYNLLKKNPMFDYYLYSDEDCRKYIENNFSEDVLFAFNKLKPGAYKSDLWRYCIMYKKGGVYLDIKFNTLEPLEETIERSQEVFVRDRETDERLTCFYNGVMISPPGNNVFKNCIDEIVENCRNNAYNINTLDVTGPCVLGRHLLNKDVQNINNYTYYFTREFINEKTIDFISYKDKRIIESYPEYREEQAITQKTEHYGDMWKNFDIYA